MKQALTWSTQKVRLGDLLEWEDNPVKLSKKEAGEIEESIRKFGLVVPLVANAPRDDKKRRLLDGHQRKKVLIVYSKMCNEEELVDVRTPSRKLSDRECEELSLRLRRNQGKLDYGSLMEIPGWEMQDFLDIGFEEDELAGVDFKTEKLKDKQETLRAKDMLRILVSVPVNEALVTRSIVDQLANVPGVEIVYGGN